MMTADAQLSALTERALNFAAGLSCRRKSCRADEPCGPCAARMALKGMREDQHTCPVCGEPVRWVKTPDSRGRVPLETKHTTIYIPKIEVGDDGPTQFVAKTGAQRHVCKGDR